MGAWPAGNWRPAFCSTWHCRGLHWSAVPFQQGSFLSGVLGKPEHIVPRRTGWVSHLERGHLCEQGCRWEEWPPNTWKHFPGSIASTMRSIGCKLQRFRVGVTAVFSGEQCGVPREASEVFTARLGKALCTVTVYLILPWCWDQVTIEVPPQHVFLMLSMKYSILGFAFRPLHSPSSSAEGPHGGLPTLWAPCAPFFALWLELSRLHMDASMTVGLKLKQRSWHWRDWLANRCHPIQESITSQAEQPRDSHPANTNSTAWAPLHQPREHCYYGKGIFLNLIYRIHIYVFTHFYWKWKFYYRNSV